MIPGMLPDSLPDSLGIMRQDSMILDYVNILNGKLRYDSKILDMLTDSLGIFRHDVIVIPCVVCLYVEIIHEL